MAAARKCAAPAWSARNRCSRPAKSFEYTSGVPLQTPSGFMTGSYGMVSGSGEHFDIDVPAFSLDSGDGKRMIN